MQSLSASSATGASPGSPGGEPSRPDDVGRRWYAGHDLRADYTRSDLRAVERELLDAHRESLAGRVLEIGCGAGRVTGPLLEIGSTVYAIDISPWMVDHCRRHHPGGSYEVMDMRNVATHRGAPFDVVIAPFNVLDALGDEGRRETLAGLGHVVAPGGLLILSSHNRAARVLGPVGEVLHSLRSGRLRRAVGGMLRLPSRLRNRQRLRRSEIATRRYAIRNDVAHDYALLHYYITADAQRRQLHEHGFELLECRDLDGSTIDVEEESASHSPELHYVARRLP